MAQPPTPEEQGLDLSQRLQGGEGGSIEVHRQLVILDARRAAFEYLATLNSNVVEHAFLSQALDRAMEVVRPHINHPTPPRKPWWHKFLGPRDFSPER